VAAQEEAKQIARCEELVRAESLLTSSSISKILLVELSLEDLHAGAKSNTTAVRAYSYQREPNDGRIKLARYPTTDRRPSNAGRTFQRTTFSDRR
jgi:hypothetical protein